MYVNLRIIFRETSPNESTTFKQHARCTHFKLRPSLQMSTLNSVTKTQSRTNCELGRKKRVSHSETGKPPSVKVWVKTGVK